MSGEIVNRVDQSGIITLDLSELIGELNYEIIDLHEQLFQGMVLREKDFRQFIKEKDWIVYTNKTVLVTCSSEAIIQDWAYMLTASKLNEVRAVVFVGTQEELRRKLIEDRLSEVGVEEFKEKRVVLKGCADEKIPGWVYAFMTTKLTPVVKSLMYGEPCSSVPVYKKR